MLSDPGGIEDANPALTCLLEDLMTKFLILMGRWTSRETCCSVTRLDQNVHGFSFEFSSPSPYEASAASGEQAVTKER